MSPFSAAAATIGIPLGLLRYSRRFLAPRGKKGIHPRGTASSQISLRFSKTRDIVSFGLSYSDYFEVTAIMDKGLSLQRIS